MQFLSLMGCINGTGFEKKISFRKWKNVMLAAAYTLCKNKGYFFVDCRYLNVNIKICSVLSLLSAVHKFVI